MSAPLSYMAQIRAGTVLGEYTVACKLGRGSFGVVYRVTDNQGETYALKVMKLPANDVDQRKIREIWTMYETRNHPNIVCLKKSFIFQESHICLAMDFVPNDLRYGLKRGKIGPNNAKEIIKLALEGIAYLHSRNIVHRDINPGNILVDYNANSLTVKVCDFGCARTVYTGAKLTPEVGNHDYAAPEVLLGLETYGEAADLWSLGCVFAEIAMNEIPFIVKSSNHSYLENNSRKLEAIFKELGTPTLDSWPEALEAPKFPAGPTSPLKAFRHLDTISSEGNNLLQGLLEMRPDKRITAYSALQHSYFTEA